MHFVKSTWRIFVSLASYELKADPSGRGTNVISANDEAESTGGNVPRNFAPNVVHTFYRIP